MLRRNATAQGPVRSAAADVSCGADVDRMLGRLRAAGLKLTPQRLAIVRQIAADESHPSAQELFDRLKPTSPSMSFATVYNTLAALCAAGLVTSLSVAPGPARFDPNMRPHDHAVCDRCGAVRDVLVGGAPPLPPSSSDGTSSLLFPTSAMTAIGFEPRAVERIFRGLCVPCARARGGPAASRAPRVATKRGRPGLAHQPVTREEPRA